MTAMATVTDVLAAADESATLTTSHITAAANAAARALDANPRTSATPPQDAGAEAAAVSTAGGR